MTSVLDLWRAVDPEARLASGSLTRLGDAVRGVLRTRTAAPHLPPQVAGELLVVDGSLVPGRSLDGLLATLQAADLHPVGLLVAGLLGEHLDATDAPLPILLSGRTVARLTDAIADYLRDEPGHLQRFSAETYEAIISCCARVRAPSLKCMREAAWMPARKSGRRLMVLMIPATVPLGLTALACA